MKKILDLRDDLNSLATSFQKDEKTVYLNIILEQKIESMLHRVLKRYKEEEKININEYILKSIKKMLLKYGLQPTEELINYCNQINPEEIIENNKGREKDKKESRVKYKSKEEKQLEEDEKEKNKSYRYYPV